MVWFHYLSLSALIVVIYTFALFLALLRFFSKALILLGPRFYWVWYIGIYER